MHYSTLSVMDGKHVRWPATVQPDDQAQGDRQLIVGELNQPHKMARRILFKDAEPGDLQHDGGDDAPGDVEDDAVPDDVDILEDFDVNAEEEDFDGIMESIALSDRAISAMQF